MILCLCVHVHALRFCNICKLPTEFDNNKRDLKTFDIVGFYPPPPTTTTLQYPYKYVVKYEVLS